MVIFDSRDAGTAAADWTDRVQRLPRPALGRPDHLVVVAAHPDDETLGAAGLMHDLARAGTRVHLVVVTDGSGSHPTSPTVSPERLAALRRDETDAALRLVAPEASVRHLALPDGGLAGSEDEVRDGIAAALDGLDGDVLVASVWSGDGHADHELVGAAAREAAAGHRFVEYPVWMWHWGAPHDARIPWDTLTALPLDESTRAVKAAAIGEHRSQIAPLSPAEGDEPVLHHAMLQHFRGHHEVLIGAEPDYFDELYAAGEDPWGYDSRWYEQRKRALALAALTRSRYPRALELGCSTGAFTEPLAERCDRLLAVDAASAAVDLASARLAAHPGVEVRRHDLAHGVPGGTFDLVVFSEVGYYLDDDVLRRVLEGARDALSENGELLVVHWRHPSAVLRRSAEEVHAVAASLGLHRQVRHEEPDLLLDLWSRDHASVAEREGLA